VPKAERAAYIRQSDDDGASGLQDTSDLLKRYGV
jgi:hypothetical protein